MFAVPIVFLVFAASGCQETFEAVAQALQQNKPVEAKAMLEAVRAQCSASGSFHELNGIASALDGKFSIAADEFGVAFSIAPQLWNDPSLLLWYAQALLETNQSGHLTGLLERRPHYPRRFCFLSAQCSRNMENTSEQ